MLRTKSLLSVARLLRAVACRAVVLSLLLCGPQQARAQDITIAINAGYLTINGVAIDLPGEPRDIQPWVNALGPYSRSTNAQHYKWSSYVWDNLGISVTNDENERPHNVVIRFKKIPGSRPWEKQIEIDPRTRATKKCFAGTFLLNGIPFNQDVSISDYNRKTKNITFHESYIPIVYSMGVFMPERNTGFTASARVGPELKPYRVELSYGYRQTTAPEDAAAPETPAAPDKSVVDEVKDVYEKAKKAIQGRMAD